MESIDKTQSRGAGTWKNIDRDVPPMVGHSIPYCRADIRSKSYPIVG